MSQVVLCNSYRQVVQARKALAESGASSLGVTTSTPKALCEDLWLVWGDGRVLVSDVQRLALSFSSLSLQGSLVQSIGMVQLLCRFVEEHAFSLLDDEGEFDASRFEGLDLHDAEIAFLHAAQDYFSSLRAHGLIEMGQACRLLAQMSLDVRASVPQRLALGPALEHLVSAWAADGQGGLPVQGADSAFQPGDGLSVPCGMEPSFLFPAGPTAVLPLVKAELLAFFGLEGNGLASADNVDNSEGAAHEQGDALPLTATVLAPNAHELYDALAPVFADRGVACSVEGSVRFSESAFGRAFLAVRALCQDDASRGHWELAAVDFAYSPWSGMSPHEAQRLDSDIRGDRLFSCGCAQKRLRAVSPTFGLFESLAGGNAERACAQLRDSKAVVESVPAMVRMRELGLVDALLELMRSVTAFGVSDEDAITLAETLSVPVSLANAGSAAVREASGAPSVTFFALGSAAALPAGAYDLVLLADMTEQAFPVKPKDVSLRALLLKLGAEVHDDQLDRQRFRFECAMEAARKRFACVLLLHDGNKEEVFPAFLLDEYLAELTASGESARSDLFNVPDRLVREEAVLGEEGVARCLGQAQLPASETVVYSSVRRGELVGTDLLQALKTVEEHGETLPVLSPSALEKYIDCPYAWFVERFVGLNQVDEGFGPLERGSFVHEVFATFYEALAAQGFKRVSPDTLAQAEAVFDQVFDERLAAQSGKPQSRYIPVTQADQLEVERLRKQLHDNVKWQARLAPGYHVDAYETRIPLEDGIGYAGARLVGRADRVDVNHETRRFAVLDYKGSSAGSAAGFSEKDDAGGFQLPEKIQTLVYAQALRHRYEGYACAGALYLGYRAKSAATLVAGSYSPLGYDVAGMAKATSQVHISFDSFLDLVENAVRPFVAGIVGGRIAPDPASKDTCKYCPFPWCERRAR